MIKIKIIEQGDVEHEIETQADLTVAELIEELRTPLNLARTDAEGNEVVWRLDNKDTGRRLVPEQTLDQNGVRDGHRLNLLRKTTAGASV